MHHSSAASAETRSQSVNGAPLDKHGEADEAHLGPNRGEGIGGVGVHMCLFENVASARAAHQLAAHPAGEAGA